MDIIHELNTRAIDYQKIKQSCYSKIVDKRAVDISVIIPVHGRSQFNQTVSRYFKKAIDHILSSQNKTVSLTFVEHSITAEHKDLCLDWVNYIYIPKGEDRFNKCLCMNIGALYSNESKYYLFHDCDIIVPEDFFEKLLLNIVDKDAIQCFTEKRLLYCDQPLTMRILSGQDEITEFNSNRGDIKVGGPGAAGGSIMINHRTFVAVGGYDAEFFTEYSIEDQFFLDKLVLVGRLGFADSPAIELFHLNHPISFNQTTKDCDFDIFNTFHSLSKEMKNGFIKQKSATFEKQTKQFMEKKNIKIYDTQFSHSGAGSFGAGDLKLPPTYFNWIREGNVDSSIRFFTEGSFHKVDDFNEPIKILLILESPLINPDIYKALHNPSLYNKFTYIFTFSKDLMAVNPDIFLWYPFGGCWIYPEDRKVYTKQKNISIIASNKMITEGHQLRHSAILKFRNEIDGVYGNGYQFVKNKIEALCNYRYSIVIENDKCDYMFSEKLIDCLVTGTIPIYWGCPSINDFFDKAGILSFNNLSELGNILAMANERYYNDNIKAVQENFERAAQFALPEDWIWNNFLKPKFDKVKKQDLYAFLVDQLLSILNDSEHPLEKTYLLGHMDSSFSSNSDELEKFITEKKLCLVKKQFGMHTYQITETGRELMQKYGSYSDSIKTAQQNKIKFY